MDFYQQKYYQMYMNVTIQKITSFRAPELEHKLQK